jgi:hypothetical protein
VAVLRVLVIVVGVGMRFRVGVRFRVRMIMLVAVAVVTMGMVMRVHLVMMVVTMIVMPVIVMPVIVMIMVARRECLFGPERAQHGRRRAALAADQFRDGGIVRHVDRVRRHFGEAVLAAEMPGEAGEAHGVLGPHLEQALLRGLDLHQSSVIEAKRVAVVEHGVHLEVHIDVKARFAVEMGVAARAGSVTEGHRIDDAVGFHGGLADDGNGAGHGGLGSGKRAGDL